MARQNLGRVAMDFKGEYSSSATYNKLDVVTYNGSSYVCNVDNTIGVIPTNTDNWDLLAQKGIDGQDGQDGYTPQRGTDYWTNADKTEIIEDAVEEVETDIAPQINSINEKIPVQASSSNKLADKEFVNSSISTNTADFKGTYNSVSELEQITADNNDYAFVIGTDAVGNTQYNRYKYNGSTWVFEYTLNNSSFTAAQWAAINSGITSALRQQITTNQSNISGIKDGTSIDSFSDVETALATKVNNADVEEKDLLITYEDETTETVKLVVYK